MAHRSFEQKPSNFDGLFMSVQCKRPLLFLFLFEKIFGKKYLCVFFLLFVHFFIDRGAGYSIMMTTTMANRQGWSNIISKTTLIRFTMLKYWHINRCCMSFDDRLKFFCSKYSHQICSHRSWQEEELWCNLTNYKSFFAFASPHHEKETLNKKKITEENQ